MHTAELMALIAEIHRNPQKQSNAYTAKDFHPTLARRAKRSVPRVPLSQAMGLLKAIGMTEVKPCR